jgi:cell wall-associated NlpC family hydrolase
LPDVFLDDLLGLPYKRGARGPKAFDCYGLCLEVCRRAGVVLPDVETPPNQEQRNEVFDATKKVWERLRKPQPWCLAAFQIGHRWHAGVVLPGCTEFIHVTAGINVSRSRLDKPYWRQKLDGFYVPDNADTESL